MIARLRPGAVALETALVLPLVFALLFGLIVGGMGVFRYQQVACLAREAARWASVRGSEWSRETGKKSPTRDEIVASAITPYAAGMSSQATVVEVHWIEQASGKMVAWDQASKSPYSLNAKNEVVANSVRIIVTYEWSPQILWFGAWKLQSISEMPMAF